MSLILRRDCQEPLDAAGLDMLHVQIQDKTLRLVGECGKPFVIISGIRFATNSPKVAEIDYAKELFIKFLAKHEKDLKELVVIKRAFKEMVRPVPTEGMTTGYNSISYNKDGCNVAFYKDGKLGASTDANTSTTVLTNRVKKFAPLAAAYWKDLKAYTKASDNVDAKSREIAKCDI